jgi:hypothetical protein
MKMGTQMTLMHADTNENGRGCHAEEWNDEASPRLMTARFFAPDGRSE